MTPNKTINRELALWIEGLACWHEWEHDIWRMSDEGGTSFPMAIAFCKHCHLYIEARDGKWGYGQNNYAKPTLPANPDSFTSAADYLRLMQAVGRQRWWWQFVYSNDEWTDMICSHYEIDGSALGLDLYDPATMLPLLHTYLKEHPELQGGTG